MNDKCEFCDRRAVLRVIARHGHEEWACDAHIMVALRNCAVREYAGDQLQVEFLDGTGKQ